MRAYLQSNHINSRDVTSSRVHYVVTAGGKRKRKKRKRVLRVILDLTYNIQHTETENKFLKKKPEKKKALGATSSRRKWRDTNWRIPWWSIPVDQYQPLSLSIWSINHRAHRWEALGNLRSIRDVTSADSDSPKLNPELFCLLYPPSGLSSLRDNSPWKWRSFVIRRLEDPLWIVSFFWFFTIRGSTSFRVDTLVVFSSSTGVGVSSLLSLFCHELLRTEY